jgi:predicted DNA-binding transcriptional regulator AlpA
MKTTQTAGADFWAAPRDALFPQPVVEAVLGVSPAWCERGRGAGYGPKFLKLGRLVRYRKADVLDWINQSPPVASTSENRGLQMSARQLNTGQSAQSTSQVVPIPALAARRAAPVKRKRQRKTQPTETVAA